MIIKSDKLVNQACRSCFIYISFDYYGTVHGSSGEYRNRKWKNVRCKGHVWNFSTQEEMHNFFECPICSYPERLKDPFHPAQKPLNLIDHFIEIASNPGDIVFDPFMGVGTTGVSSVKKGRRFIGSELNCDYVTAANKRIASYM